MALISNILDALRRVGSSTQKSALRRQDRQIEGHVVIERGRRIVRNGDESVTGFHAVLEPEHEEMTVLEGAELETILSNAALADELFDAFGVGAIADPLDRLDRAFQEWLRGDDRHGYRAHEIVEILGASFGEHCNETLQMRWVRVSDRYGVSLAVDGVEAEFRAYPFNSIEKRIADSEHTFFRGIHILLADQKQRSRRRVAP
jgi:hypothetical protein